MNKIIVTTSWDDGHILDLKLADLLNRYKLPGTFYISPKNRQISQENRLSEDMVKTLSKKDGFEIGAHTMTHPLLSKINNAEAKEEIISSKKILEKWTGAEIKSFCYPSGDYTSRDKAIVEDAHFSLARTVTRFHTSIGGDPFEMPTTIHAYRHWSDMVAILQQFGVATFLNQYLNWDELAVALFRRVQKQGGVFHLWGHSWEIEKNNDWSRLENVFKHISNLPDVHYLTNGKLI